MLSCTDQPDSPAHWSYRFIVGNRLFVLRQNILCQLFQETGIGILFHALFFDDRNGILVLFYNYSKDLLCRCVGDDALFHLFDQSGQMFRCQSSFFNGLSGFVGVFRNVCQNPVADALRLAVAQCNARIKQLGTGDVFCNQRGICLRQSEVKDITLQLTFGSSGMLSFSAWIFSSGTTIVRRSGSGK